MAQDLAGLNVRPERDCEELMKNDLPESLHA
jgi:hypothetical protein